MSSQHAAESSSAFGFKMEREKKRLLVPKNTNVYHVKV